MSLELSGTTGVKGVAGSISAPSIVGDDINTGISFPAADTIKFSTGGVERMAITNSGVTGTGIGGGKILQVVQAVKTDTFSSSSASLVDITGLSLSITPASASNKILVSVDVNFSITVVNRWILLQLVRGSTAIYRGDAASNRSRASVFTSLFDATGRSTHIMNSHIHFLDSPNTTSATTYKLQGTCQNDSSPSFVINRGKDDDDANYGGRTASSITAMEVAA